MAEGNPEIGPLYVKMTDSRVSPDNRSVTLPGVLDMIGKLSVTSQFKLSLHLAPQTLGGPTELMAHLTKTKVLDKQYGGAQVYDFLCSDASLPGMSLDLSQEAGSYQGVIEQFPIRRIYPPLDVTFYVDSEFKVIRLFEEWINFINPLYTLNGIAESSPTGMEKYNSSDSFFRLRYPKDYKRIISITKFERDFRPEGDTNGKNIVQKPTSVTYRLIDAFPTTVNSIPVTYEGSTITKTTVSFIYSRYVMGVSERKD